VTDERAVVEGLASLALFFFKEEKIFYKKYVGMPKYKIPT
jgi:hypothetical protein